MHFYSPQLWILLAASLLAGCSTLPSSTPPEPTQTVTTARTTDQTTECVGSIQAPAVGLEAISDPELLQSALGQPDKGQLCMGQVFVATAPVTVYRVWDQAKSYTLYGRWGLLVCHKAQRINTEKPMLFVLAGVYSTK